MMGRARNRCSCKKSPQNYQQQLFHYRAGIDHGDLVMNGMGRHS